MSSAGANIKINYKFLLVLISKSITVSYFYKHLSTFQIWLKLDNTVGHFTWRLNYVCIIDSRTKYFATGQRYKGTNCCVSMVTLNYSIHLTAACRSTTIQTELSLRSRGKNGYANAPQLYVMLFYEIILVTGKNYSVCFYKALSWARNQTTNHVTT
jgi:hypothetical protein